MRVVLDTDVGIAGMRSPRGASAAILRAADDGKDVTLLLTTALALEYEAICSLPEHRVAAGLKTGDVVVFLNGLIGMAEPVEIHFLWRPQLRDAADEMVLEAAVNGHADAIVTFNRRDFGAAPERFGIELLQPRDCLRRLRI